MKEYSNRGVALRRLYSYVKKSKNSRILCGEGECSCKRCHIFVASMKKKYNSDIVNAN